MPSWTEVLDDLEADNHLQDLILTVHHAFMHTFANSSAIKIVENHEGRATVIHAHVKRQGRIAESLPNDPASK